MQTKIPEVDITCTLQIILFVLAIDSLRILQ